MNLLPKHSKSVSVFANNDAKSVARLLLETVWDASSSSHRRGARCRAIDRYSLEPLETRSMMAAGAPVIPAVPTLTIVESRGAVSLLKDSAGLAYVQEVGKQPIVVSRADSYWSGTVPLARNGATMLAAELDSLGRLRVLDTSSYGQFGWILDTQGKYIGQEKYD
jgi:hypothetical protein